MSENVRKYVLIFTNVVLHCVKVQ